MSADELPDARDPRLTAGIALLRRTGSQSMQLRYSDDEQPVVWMAVCEWRVDERGRPVKEGGRVAYEAAASLHPPIAVQRLLDQVVDGGQCPVCGRPTSVVHDGRPGGPILGELTCVWAYDVEREHYVRTCDGKEAK